MTVGKVIQFTILYSIPTGVKRDYGTVFLQSGESLPDAAVSEGWVKLRDDAARKDDSEESKALLEKLELEEAKAKAASKGVWASASGKMENTYEISDPKHFVEQWKGRPLEAIIERVLSGDRMIVRLFLTRTKHVQTMVLVAGIRAPTTKRTNTSDGKEQPAEPFGTESHQFVETRLLQRSVEVDVLGVSPQGQLVCTVKHPNGSIAGFLLKAGLARCTDFHSIMLGVEMTSLRQAEKEAKDKRLGIFQGLVDKRSGAGEIDATITRVQTADTVYFRDKSGEEKRASLSSIRQPKPTDPKQAPFQADAKEFLRKKTIGKHVRIAIDGKKAASEGFEERDVVTIMVNNKNVALHLVEAGYASVIRHRRDDGECELLDAEDPLADTDLEDRSPFYDELLAAEEAAQKEEKGMWSPKSPAAKTYQDYSESLQKAKIQSSVLQRQKKIPAIVDYVKGGSRFTVLIPRENAKLTFVLSGIRAPRSARNANEKSEPFGQEAHDFATRRCMQRDVEIDVEATDKVGGFIGTLYINRENFAKLLLEEGLASVHAYSAEQSGNATELFAAEDKAKDAKKGMWHDYDPSINEPPLEDLTISEPATNGNTDSVSPRKKDYRDVIVTHIDPASAHLKLQLIGPSTSAALTTLMSAFATYHRSPPTSERSLPNPPKAGDLVAARFSEDGQWYRARIRRNDREAKKADVLFFDYGNNETLAWSELRPMTQPQFSPTKLKPQAIDSALSFLQLPNSPEYLSDAVKFLEQVTAEKQLVASVDFEEKDGSTLWITLFDAETEGGEEASVNAEVVAEGMAMVGRKLKAWEKARGKVVEGLRQKEEEAKKERMGMWEYGDLTED
ncbi:hypothetical protein MMC28_002343 [Mycoblastus sanguinarius]|nr:hypothetical protein [Mycoblastus sanguinarius]